MFVQSPTEAHFRYCEEWASMQHSVVICGRDNMLLSTRKLVLEQAGLSVRIAFGIEQLADAVADVLVLCYTLSAEEKSVAAARFHARLPRAKVLILGGGPESFSSDYCEALAAYPGPKSFIKQVGRLAGLSILH